MPRRKRDVERVNFYIQKPVHSALKAMAEHRGVPVSQLVRDGLKEYVDNYRQQNTPTHEPVSTTSPTD